MINNDKYITLIKLLVFFKCASDSNSHNLNILPLISKKSSRCCTYSFNIFYYQLFYFSLNSFVFYTIFSIKNNYLNYLNLFIIYIKNHHVK